MAKTATKGVAVRALQRLLLHRGPDVEVNGSFGPATANAVKAFQSANGLEADGAVGTETWSKLVVPVRRGQSGEPVLAVQELLGIAADGEFGPETEKPRDASRSASTSRPTAWCGRTPGSCSSSRVRAGARIRRSTRT